MNMWDPKPRVLGQRFIGLLKSELVVFLSMIFFSIFLESTSSMWREIVVVLFYGKFHLGKPLLKELCKKRTSIPSESPK
jgi:hypothetical protein